MKISNELLATYAEGKVSDAERKNVRQYLMEHPDQLESLMIMMDKDYELELDEDTYNVTVSHESYNCVQFHDIALSSAAFAPHMHFDKSTNSTSKSNNGNIQDAFFSELDKLIAEIDILKWK